MSIHSSTMSNPQTRLLQRWTSIYERMSHARLSCDAVIRLNRSLDLADEVVCDGAAMGEDSKILKKAAVCETPRLDLSRRSLGEVDESANLLSTAPNYAAQYMEPREYEILLARLTEAVDLLRHRQQEFKRLHEMMVKRIEKQEDDIQQLHRRSSCLQQDVVDDESELTYLKLQLRIIEIQTLPYWPRKDQDELAAGIERWKCDWADVNKRCRKRRWKRQEGNAHQVDSGSSANIGVVLS